MPICAVISALLLAKVEKMRRVADALTSVLAAERYCDSDDDVKPASATIILPTTSEEAEPAGASAVAWSR